MLLLWIKVDSFIPIMLPNLNPICHLLALGAHHILHVGMIRVKSRNSSVPREIFGLVWKKKFLYRVQKVSPTGICSEPPHLKSKISHSSP